MDRLTVGLIGLSADRRVQYANSEALRILSLADPLTLRTGRLVASDGQQSVLSALFNSSPDANAATCAVLDSQSGERLVVLREMDGMLVSPEGGSNLWLIDNRRAVAQAAWLANAFGLTKAEAGVVECLAGGFSTEEIATHLRVSIATTRTHLQRIYAKTGARNQGSLVRLALLKSVA